MSELHLRRITVCFPENLRIILVYKNDERCEAAANLLFHFDNAALDAVDLTDDFGTSLRAKTKDIVCVIHEDLNLVSIGTIECSLHAARTQADLDGRASNDPVLRNAAFRQARPAIVGPGSARNQ